tara:strand:- start:828 stop:1031 length:204 start_codon:yes stop_codon:yes gene_type:complete
MNMIIEPSEYVANHNEVFLDQGASLEENVQNAIINNKLPLGMSIDYALEILNIIYEAKPNKIIFKEV